MTKRLGSLLSIFALAFAGCIVGCNDDSSTPSVALTETIPASPANNPSPIVRGTAPAKAKVEIFVDAECEGQAVATTAADAEGFFEAMITVPRNTTTQISAQAESD